MDNISPLILVRFPQKVNVRSKYNSLKPIHCDGINFRFFPRPHDFGLLIESGNISDCRSDRVKVPD